MSRQSAVSGKRGLSPVSNNPLSMAGSIVHFFKRPMAQSVNLSISSFPTRPPASTSFLAADFVASGVAVSTGGGGGTVGGMVGSAVGGLVGGTGVGVGLGVGVGAFVAVGAEVGVGAVVGWGVAVGVGSNVGVGVTRTGLFVGVASGCPQAANKTNPNSKNMIPVRGVALIVFVKDFTLKTAKPPI